MDCNDIVLGIEGQSAKRRITTTTSIASYPLHNIQTLQENYDYVVLFLIFAQIYDADDDGKQ